MVKRKTPTDSRARKLARFLRPGHPTGMGGPCQCYSCSGQHAYDYAARIISTAEAAGLKVIDPEAE